MDMSVWFLVGAILVFFMQCGFAMVETGFTRAKNAGNIIMKNLMDFCIGTVVFVLLGYGIMNSENYFFGLIGMPEYQMFTSFYDSMTLTGPISFSSWCSAPRRRPSSPAQWRSAPNFWHTVSTPALSAPLSTPLKPAGCGTARAGWFNWDMWTLPDLRSFIWWAACPLCWAPGCWGPGWASTARRRTGRFRSTPFRVTR